MTRVDLHTLALFAGGKGLDLGVELCLPQARCVCYVEIEAYAAATLAARMEEGTMASAPIWSDVSTFDGHRWRGRVDLITGGFPCQDISVAGAGAGLDGKRSGLWYEYARIIGEVQPKLVFIENVAALCVRGFDRVLASLAALGFNAEWDCFRASDAGAPHKRERVFVLAYSHEFSEKWGAADEERRRISSRSGQEMADSFGERIWNEPRRGSGPSGSRSPFAGISSATVANADVERCNGINALLLKWRSQSDRVEATGRSEEMGNPNEPRLEGWSESVEGSAYERVTWPPGPEEFDQWREYLRLLPGIEPAICRGAHGLAAGLEYRTDRLRLNGNGVVPQVAALAFKQLAERAFGSLEILSQLLC